jgi:hypothetical protein
VGERARANGLQPELPVFRGRGPQSIVVEHDLDGRLLLTTHRLQSSACGI